MSNGSEQVPERPRLTEAQETALSNLCDRYGVDYNSNHYHRTFDLPPEYVAGYIGGYEIQAEHPTIYCGCSGDGVIST